MAEPGKILTIIPARAGSKRLPRKNILKLAGKPLIAWTIEAAIDAGISHRIIVSTDDPEATGIARSYPGIHTLNRSPDLATDTASTTDVILDVVEREKEAGNEYSTIVLLQPTSPLRIAEDILRCVEAFSTGNGGTTLTVCEVEHPLEWCGTVDKESNFNGAKMDPTKRSQDFEKQYRLNGAVYVIDCDSLLQSSSLFTEHLKAVVMPRERSIDIDSPLDFKICESILSED